MSIMIPEHIMTTKPEGATHYSPDVDLWYRQDKKIGFYCWDQWVKRWTRTLTMIELPIPLTERGPEDGLPPVGEEVEYNHEKYGWIGVKVVGHDGESITVVRSNDGYHGAHPHEIRDSRTPEQIEAEERNKAIADMCWIITRLEGVKGQWKHGYYQHVAEMIYNAGYRKQAQE